MSSQLVEALAWIGGVAVIEYSFVTESGATETCSYENKALVARETRDCPEYDDAKDGFPNVSPEEEPHVPKERDPRRTD